MQLVTSFIPPLFQVDRSESTEKLQNTQSSPHTMFSFHVPGSSFWSWDECKVRIIRYAELTPDLFTLADSTKTLVNATYHSVPIVLRVTFASVGLSNMLMIPVLVKYTHGLLTRLIPNLFHRSIGGSIDFSLKLSYIGTLVVACSALVTFGINEARSLLNLSPILGRFLNMVVPYLSYIIRLSAILQIMDIFCGARFTSQIDDAMKISERRPDWMANRRFPVMAMLNPINSLSFVFQGIKDSCDRAKASVDIIKHNRRYLRRANGHAIGLKTTVKRLEAGLQSWNPIRCLGAIAEANQLAVKLRDRSVGHITYQVYGLGANAFGLFAMLLTNSVAVAIFALGSAGYYISQTVHGWYMDSSPQFDKKRTI